MIESSLGSFCEITPGPSGTVQGELAEAVDGVPVLTPPEITQRNTIDARTIRNVSHEHAGTLARFRLEEGDLVCVRQGSLGRFALIGATQAGWLYGSACMRLRVRRNADGVEILPAYLLLYLTYPPVRDWLLARANPGTVPTINVSALAAVPVTVPPMARQRSIAGALAAIDDQVESYRQSLERLEQLRPALFAEFLGDSLPVHYAVSSQNAYAEPRRNVSTRRSGRMS
jgi:type I restriction enzyme S subunit